MREQRSFLSACALCLGALVVFLSATPIRAELSGKDWSALQQEVQAALREGAADRGWPALEGLFPRIAGDDSARAVELISKLVKSCNYDGGIQREAKAALGNMHADPAVNAMAKEAKRSSEWKLQILYLDVLVDRHHPSCHEILMDLIGSRKDAVAMAAIQMVGADPWNEAVDKVLERMCELDTNRGAVWEACRGVMARVTGEERSAGSAYRIVWAQHKSGRTSPPTTGAPQEAHGTVTLFGAAITCTRMVFILDTSGSMQAVDPDRRPVRGTAAGGQRPSGSQGQPQAGQGGQAPQDPTDERQRLRRAKTELTKVVEGLAETVEFNILAYSSGVETWSREGLKRANAANKTSAKAFIAQFQADGTTWTDDALRVAYEENADAYCFYLLSDGDPTHEGGNPPADTQFVVEAIYRMVEEMKVRRDTPVVVHTLGFVGANRQFMQTLAEMTGGTYRDIE